MGETHISMSATVAGSGDAVYLTQNYGTEEPYTVKVFDPYGRRSTYNVFKDPLNAIEMFLDLTLAPAGKQARLMWDNTGE